MKFTWPAEGLGVRQLKDPFCHPAEQRLVTRFHSFYALAREGLLTQGESLELTAQSLRAEGECCLYGQ